MRIAAIYDIHGNLPALEAVMAEIRAVGVDQVVVGGDVVPGPLPAETLRCLLALEVPTQFLCGNGEVAVLEVMAGAEPRAVPEAYRPGIRWSAARMAEYEGVMRGWGKTCRIGDVLFCHATPRDENEIFTRLTDEARLLPLFDGLDAAMVVCGHTHMQFDRMIGRTRVVNAGSVGMPFGPAGADWLLLDGEDVQLRHTGYDFAAAERLRATGYPDVEFLLKPPSEEVMLAAFSKAELK